MQETNIKKVQRHESLFSIYARHTAKYPWLFFLIILGSIGMQASSLAVPLFLREFFNTLTLSQPTPDVVAALTITIAIIGLLNASNWVMNRVQNFSINFIEARVIADLMKYAFDYLMGHSYNFFTSNFAGTLVHKVNRFAKAYEDILDIIMVQFLPTSLFVSGAVVILFLHNAVLGLILGTWVVVFVCFQIWVAYKRQPLRAERSKAESESTGILADVIGNQMTVSLFAAKKEENNRFNEAVLRWRAATIRAWRADEWTWAAQSFLMIFINLALLYGAMRFWQLGKLTIGDFVLIQSYLLTTFGQLLSINWQLRRFYNTFSDAKEMLVILNEPHDIQDITGAKPTNISKGAIEFKQVNFAFHDRPVLNDFNLTIAPHEKIALVGPSGAGKSTITKLLLRFYDLPHEGGKYKKDAESFIAIDNQDISKVTQDSLREHIAFVPQEPILFHRTLMENIRYGRRDATDEEVLEAARQAHCHEFISQLPLKYETFVGERGIKLSGGERQRVAIARAILKNAPILVLDEATSSLDSESEALIQDALEVLMKGKTVVVIAHRLSTIMKMDRIIVVEQGKIIAQGTHQKLLEEDGLYQRLWNIQVGGYLAVDEDDTKALAQEFEER